MKVVIALLVAGCTVKGSTETGPTVHVTVSGLLDSVSDQSTARVIHLEAGETAYPIDVTIQSMPGEERQDGDSFPDYHPLSTFDAAITVPGVTVPMLNWLDDGYGDGGYRLQPTLHVPASAQGQTMSVHVDGVSDDGLESNVIDLEISLQ